MMKNNELFHAYTPETCGPAKMPDSNNQEQLSTISRYVLMTAAHNEEATIERTIESVISQSQLPAAWAIVSDNSNDGTYPIIQKYQSKYSWIRSHHVTRPAGRSFAAKAKALKLALNLLDGLQYDLIGNIDADVALDRTFFATLIERFDQDRRLGLGGGYVYEDTQGEFTSRRLNNRDAVSHAAQLARRSLFEDMGGYPLLKFGGEDWYASVMARMRGWHAAAFDDLKIYHFRPCKTPIRSAFRSGRMDYSFGSYPPFEALKCLRRCYDKPFLPGIVRMAGFIWEGCCGEGKLIPQDLAEFLRNEQKGRVHALFQRALRGSGPSHQGTAQY